MDVQETERQYRIWRRLRQNTHEDAPLTSRDVDMVVGLTEAFAKRDNGKLDIAPSTGDAIGGIANAAPAALVHTLTKRDLREAIGISETELRSRLKLNEICLATEAKPRAKRITLDLMQFSEQVRQKILNRLGMLDSLDNAST